MVLYYCLWQQLHIATKLSQYIQMLLKQLRYKQTTPTLIYTDNSPVSQMINDNSSPAGRTRHINICYFVI